MRRALPVLIIAAALAMPAAASAQIRVSCFAPAATPCSNVWHTQPVTIDWSLDTGWAPTSGCVDETISTDTKGAARHCDAKAGNETAGRGVTIQLDQTPPVVTGARAARAPDGNGWYRSPVQISFSGRDATSGLLGCSATSYSGPDTAAVNLLGRCQDVAGNVSAASAFGLRYDATPPALSGVRASASDHTARLRWNIPGGAAVDVWRTRAGGRRRHVLSAQAKGTLVDRHLRNGRRYDYELTATDPAGNIGRRTITLVPGPRLLAPTAGARVAGPPLLRWTPVHGARYYNVQLYRGKHKLLSVWPTRPRLQLDRAWTYAGARRALARGRSYRWFVWPGRGPRSRNAYGPLVGTRTFTFARPAAGS